jgi:hypothetical protein
MNPSPGQLFDPVAREALDGYPSDGGFGRDLPVPHRI